MEIKNKLYKEIAACSELRHFAHSFWMHKNPSDKTQIVTISASSFIKYVIFVNNGKITYYVLTGLWTNPKEIHVPPFTTVYGCRMKVLAPEFLLNREVTSLLNIMESQNLSFLNIENFAFADFNSVVEKWQEELLKIKSPKTIPLNKLRLSNLLDLAKGNISPKDVANQIFWTNRQINRYLNKYIGISLKKYLSLQKCRESISNIVHGKFSPDDNFYDQPHFIREVKKFTGSTPKKIFQLKNDRFIQLSNISNK